VAKRKIIKTEETYYKELSKKIRWVNDLPYWKAQSGTMNIGEIAGYIDAHNYRTITITLEGKRKLIKAHRLRWYMEYGYVPSEIDHVDRNRSNNSVENLREVTRSQNNMNGTKHKNCTSRYIGVSWNKDLNKWGACVCYKNKKYQVGCFDNEEEAAIARDKKAIEIQGEFANLNFKETVNG
jgi:hypothetical protein